MHEPDVPSPGESSPAMDAEAAAGYFDHSFGRTDVTPSAPRVTDRHESEEQETERRTNERAGSSLGTAATLGPRQPQAALPASSHDRANENDAAANQPSPASGSGQRLPPAQRKEYESLLGQNLDGVRIHTDAAAETQTRSLGARAFARGREIHFRRGHFQPHTPAGRWLLTHELTHTLRSQTNVVARNGVGTPMGPATNLRPSTPAEDREFVQLAIEFIQHGKEHYDPAFSGFGGNPRGPVFQRPPVSRDQLVRQLDGWKATATQCVTLIGTTLNNDAVLNQQIRQTYRDAVQSAVTAAGIPPE
jgi:hypothetical protein